MKQIVLILKIILIILFLPFTLIYYLCKFIIKVISNNKVSKTLQNLTIQSIDTLSGAEFEMLLGAMFSNMNYHIKQTKKSHDFGCDLIATKNFKTYIIQAKLYYNRSVGNAGIYEVRSALDYYKGDIAIAITNSYFSKPAKQLANKINVKLIDRDKLINLFGSDIKQREKLFLSIIQNKKE